MKYNWDRMEKKHYICTYLLLSIVTFLLYCFSLYRCIPGLSPLQSIALLAGTVVLCGILNFLINFKSRRSLVSLMLSVFLPYCLFNVFVYSSILLDYCLGQVWIMLGFFALYGALLMFCPIDPRYEKKKIIKKRLKHWTIMSYAAFSFVFFVIGSTFLGIYVFEHEKMEPMYYARSEPEENVRIKTSLDELVLLEQEKWELLNPEEKLNILQTAANIERTCLGIPLDLKVGMQAMRPATLGTYHDEDRLIVLNTSHLKYDEARECLNTVLHEAYHAYEHCQVKDYLRAHDSLKDLLIFEDARTYAREFGSYNGWEGEESFYDYYYQLCEENARRYAEKGVDDYYRKIHEYLNGNSETSLSETLEV